MKLAVKGGFQATKKQPKYAPELCFFILWKHVNLIFLWILPLRLKMWLVLLFLFPYTELTLTCGRHCMLCTHQLLYRFYFIIEVRNGRPIVWFWMMKINLFFRTKTLLSMSRWSIFISRRMNSLTFDGWPSSGKLVPSELLYYKLGASLDHCLNTWSASQSSPASFSLGHYQICWRW